MNQLLKIEPQINISNSRRIVDARNKIIHGYDEKRFFAICNIYLVTNIFLY